MGQGEERGAPSPWQVKAAREKARSRALARGDEGDDETAAGKNKGVKVQEKGVGLEKRAGCNVEPF